MSRESAVALTDRFKSDEAFRSEVLGAPDVESRRGIVRDAGYEIDSADVPIVEEALADAGGELSDSDLQAVAGGGILAPSYGTCFCNW